eukprot:270071-Chlamydomonas_euryale.AAC.2
MRGAARRLSILPSPLTLPVPPTPPPLRPPPLPFQVGLAEMQECVQHTGGMVVQADTFNNPVFRESLKRLFARDGDDGFLGVSSNATVEVIPSKDIKVSGCLGPVARVPRKSSHVADNEVGVGGTTQWKVGAIEKILHMHALQRTPPHPPLTHLSRHRPLYLVIPPAPTTASAACTTSLPPSLQLPPLRQHPVLHPLHHPSSPHYSPIIP